MNLIDENYNEKSNKKIFSFCIAGIIVLFLIIMGLLAYLTTLNSGKIKLKSDGNSYKASTYLINRNDTLYISVEQLTKITKSGYTYKSGSKDLEDANKCYITNQHESTFFEVDSNEIYKVLEETNETEYYTLDKPVIKENNAIYIPIDCIETAANVNYSNVNNDINISSIAYLESFYNQKATETFVPNSSIVWETTYSNKKLLKFNIVIITDEAGNLGLGKVYYEKDKKTKKTKILVQSIIDPKYSYIKYVEKFNQLIVKTDSGAGIVQLERDNSGNFSAKTIIVPQYENIKQIEKDLYLVSEKVKSNSENQSSTITQYGIVNEEGDTILPVEYDEIGFDVSDFTNNDLNSEYVIYNRYIPVKKDDLWGFINLTGKVVIGLQYTDIGCIGTNASSNVLVIPEIDAIVVKQDENYGIISNTGKVLINGVLTKVYKENSNGEEVYTMVYDNKKYNVIDYIKNLDNKEEDDVIENVSEQQ